MVHVVTNPLPAPRCGSLRESHEWLWRLFSTEGNMVSMHLAAVVLAESGVGDVGHTVLLDFQATWCGPCRSMESTVAQLKAQGYPVRKVDVDREPDLVARYGIGPIP